MVLHKQAENSGGSIEGTYWSPTAESQNLPVERSPGEAIASAEKWGGVCGGKRHLEHLFVAFSVRIRDPVGDVSPALAPWTTG